MSHRGPVEDPVTAADRLVRQAETAWRQGDARQAETLCRAALAALPHHLGGLHLMALLELAVGQREQALARLDLALRLAPGEARLHATAAEALATLGREADGLAHWDRAVSLAPADAQLHLGRGAALHRASQYEQAMTAFGRVAELAPSNATAWSNLAEACRRLDRLEEAVAHGCRAVQLAPRDRAARYNLALALSDAGELVEAERRLRELLSEQPGDAEAEFELSELLLRQGRWLEGWRAYEARYRMAHTQGLLPQFQAPRWDGREMPGETLLVYGEQGFGDTLQFARFLDRARARVGGLVLGASAELRPLFENHPAVDEVFVAWDKARVHAAQVPMTSLGLCVGGAEVGMAAPYLQVPETARHNAARLLELGGLVGAATGLKVGLVWAGRPTHQDDRRRSLPLRELGPLMDISGLTYVSLQKGPAEADALSWAGSAPLFLAGPYLRNFADTAALLTRLDLLIAVDTAVVHLAGALGVTTWVMLSQPCDWRWGDATEHSAWYPSVRLFRQTRPGDWTDVVARMRAALATEISVRQP
jgi:tetratricopeptide (TPR) repeat protein